MASASVLALIGRWFLLGGTLSWVGAATVRWFLMPAWRRTVERESDLGLALSKASTRVAIVGSMLLIAGTVSRLQTQVVDFVDPFDPPGPQVQLLLTSTFWGRIWTIQAVVVLLGSLGFWIHWKTGGSRAAHIGGVAALVAAALPALSGHAVGAGDLAFLAVLFDFAHVLAAGVWLGALAILLVLLLLHHDWSDERDRRDLVVLIGLFSPMALGAAAVIATSGAFSGWLHVGDVAGLLTDPYGRALLRKLVLVGLVVALGAFNWRRLKPRLGSAAAPGQLTWSILVELGLAALVLLATAILVVTPPGPEM